MPLYRKASRIIRYGSHCWWIWPSTITFDSGAVVSYRGSWVSPGPKTCWSGEWDIECTRGEIVWTSRGDTASDQVTVRPLGKRTRRVKLPEIALTDRRGSLQAFVQAVRTGQEPECSGRDNLHSLALMYAAVEAATFRSCISLAGRKADAGVN